MDLVPVFIDIFYETATAFVPLMVPVVVLILVFKFLTSILYEKRL